MKVNVNLTGEINQMKEKGIKPNFSDLARKYGSDRKTIKKIWDNDGKPKRKASSRAIRYDPYLEEISSLMARPSVSKIRKCKNSTMHERERRCYQGSPEILYNDLRASADFMEE